MAPGNSSNGYQRESAGESIQFRTDSDTRQAITELVSQGMSLAKTADALNAAGMRTARGVEWTRFNVHRLVELMREEDSHIAQRGDHYRCRPLLNTCTESGLDARVTAQVLNEAGYRTILGKRWTEAAVNAVLRTRRAVVTRVYVDWLAEYGEKARIPSEELTGRVERAVGRYPAAA